MRCQLYDIVYLLVSSIILYIQSHLIVCNLYSQQVHDIYNASNMLYIPQYLIDSHHINHTMMSNWHFNRFYNINDNISQNYQHMASVFVNYFFNCWNFFTRYIMQCQNSQIMHYKLHSCKAEKTAWQLYF